VRPARNLFLLSALLVLPAVLAPAASSGKLADSAPADQYFGKIKLSFLGINNTFKDTAISAGDHTTDPALASKVDFAIDALNDWQRKFPRDPQLARTYFLAQLTLKKLWIEKYQDKAWSYMRHIVIAYPTTFYARTIKADIARGFTRHFFAAAVPCDAAATPTPSVTTNNGKYKTVVETPPCITPSPSPSPSIEPSAMPSAEPGLPAPASSASPAAPAPSASPAAPAPSASPAAPAPSAPPAASTPSAPATPVSSTVPATPASSM
jgi:hypothetical protein